MQAMFDKKGDCWQLGGQGGRPRIRWKECVKEDLEVAGLKEEDVRDRTRWDKAICTSDPN